MGEGTAACLNWSRIYVRPRGLCLTSQERGRFAALLGEWGSQDVRVIVVTDGSRILGLGDLGANGMGIPIGKLVLYSACAGIDPRHCLPVVLDIGTANEPLLQDPHYLGVQERRLRGPAYDATVEEFVASAEKVCPGVLIQFEDFSSDNAFRLLEQYRGRACAFNDDIQSTGAMALAGLLAAQRITGRRLPEERILFVGAGGANIGIGARVIAAMMKAGLGEGEARQRCWFADSRGLVVSSRTDLTEHKRAYAQSTRGVHAGSTWGEREMATVGEICNREVVVTTRETSVADAARLMRDHHVGSLIVAEPRDGAQYPVGIITDRDLVVEIMAMDLDPRDVNVGEVMGRGLVIARESDGIRETLEVMRFKGVRRLPVLSARDNLLGIVAADDLMKILAEDITALATITTRERWREAAQRKPVSV